MSGASQMVVTLGDNDRSNKEFEWRDEVIAVGEQLQIAVYTNPAGNIVVRQRDAWNDEDPWIVVRPENVPALCRALMAEAGIEPADTPLLAAPSLGAQRQKRYRERHARNAASVTSDGGDRHGQHRGGDAGGDGELPLGMAAE